MYIDCRSSVLKFRPPPHTRKKPRRLSFPPKVVNIEQKQQWRSVGFKHMIRCSISTIIRMISSPYFTASGRQTRSATRAAADALGKKKKPARKHVKIEYESENQDGGRERASDDLKEDVASKKRKKDTSVTKKQSSDWEPANWREQLANIREMRKLRDAPVDSQGCEKTADMNQSAEVSVASLWAGNG